MSRVPCLLRWSAFLAVALGAAGMPGRLEPQAADELPQAAQLVETPQYLLYLPHRTNRTTPCPLIVAFSPHADAHAMIRLWKGVADDHQWMLLASRAFRNGIDTSAMDVELISYLGELIHTYTLDPFKIVATGFSGGGMHAYDLAFQHPRLFCAVVVNTGVMRDDWRQSHTLPHQKLAVLLASPEDVLYEEMRLNQQFLLDLQWKTLWIEFDGGHSLGPLSAYDRVGEWLEAKWDARDRE